MEQCKICGDWNCKVHIASLGKIKRISSFEGSSPPEIFVGRWNYPNVYVGVLAPQQHGDTSHFSSSERWHGEKLGLQDIASLRNQLIYGRTQSHVKKLSAKFGNTMKEVAMTHKSVSAQFALQKPIAAEDHGDPHVPMISRAAPVEHVTLQENAQVKPKIDYLVNDTSAKASEAVHELYGAGIHSEHIIKLLSAGLLGRKVARKLVPSRWAITAVDDTLSKEKLKDIKTFPVIDTIKVFHAEYLGNHYEFILFPEPYSFEVIEISTEKGGVWRDYESNFPRKQYADSVTGAYYANRLALTEYLMRIKRQAACLVLREIRPEYTIPCGVGILRETSREAFASEPEEFSSPAQAFEAIQSRLTLPRQEFMNKSWLLTQCGKQRKLTQFF